jgi:hypothetical protein
MYNAGVVVVNSEVVCRSKLALGSKMFLGLIYQA